MIRRIHLPLLLALALLPACAKAQAPVENVADAQEPAHENREVRLAEVRVEEAFIEVDGVAYQLPFELVDAARYKEGGSIMFQLTDGAGEPFEFLINYSKDELYPRGHMFWGVHQPSGRGEAPCIADKSHILAIMRPVRVAYDQWMSNYVPDQREIEAGLDKGKALENIKRVLEIEGVW